MSTRRLRMRGSHDRVPDEGRHWPLARIFGAVAAVAALLSVIAAVVGSLALARLNGARAELLDTIGPAVRTGQALVTALVDQETGVRGYELSRREETLRSYRTGQVAELQANATLRRLAPQVPGLGADLDGIEAATGAWRTGYAEPAMATAAGTAAPGPVTDGGRALFDKVRAAGDRMAAGLEVRRLAARDRLDTAATFVSVVGMVVAVVAVLFFVVAGIVLRRAVIRPISRLADQVRGVVSGDIGQHVSGTGPREIAALGGDVEAMRAHIVREVDALSEVNLRLDGQTRDLERSNRDLEQFAYVASHDLQEPLRKVASFCQLLQRRYGGTLDERADQYIGFAVDGAQRMQVLINDLLAFSRVGRTTASFVTVPLADVVGEVADQHEPRRAEADGEIVIGELPSVPGDRGLLTQLFANLVGNALKFRRDGVAPVVRIGARPAPDPAEGWEVSVSDNGIGIEPEYVDKVFVIFQRLHARDAYGGTGIGLALAKKIVEFHGGRIWIETATDGDAGGSGPGTTIRFTLPAVGAGADLDEPATPRAESERPVAAAAEGGTP